MERKWVTAAIVKEFNTCLDKETESCDEWKVLKTLPLHHRNPVSKHRLIPITSTK